MDPCGVAGKVPFAWLHLSDQKSASIFIYIFCGVDAFLRDLSDCGVLLLLLLAHPSLLGDLSPPQELESLEGCNLALKKEIASLKKEALFYTEALERHQPLCRLQEPGSDKASASASSPTDTSSASLSGRSRSEMSPPGPHSLFHPSDPPPPSPRPASVPQTHPTPLVENPIISKPSSAASPGLLLSLLTVPSPPGAPQTSAGPSDGPPAQQEDLGFLELLEHNDWILQEGGMNRVVSNQ